jgi:hypothetical protein
VEPIFGSSYLTVKKPKVVLIFIRSTCILDFISHCKLRQYYLLWWLQRIPEKFVREFGDELSAVATLTIPYGHIWQVGLEKANKKIWFHDGWQDFMEYHSIHYGYFLVFRYEGNSKFHVLVFDNTATEIQYTRSKNCKLEDQVDVMESDDAKKSSCARGRERAIQAARMLKPKRPSFMAILRPHIIYVNKLW